jgi:hypothetical protein
VIITNPARVQIIGRVEISWWTVGRDGNVLMIMMKKFHMKFSMYNNKHQHQRRRIEIE